ncbi:MAG: UV DNA damage repair endonuclease UvsE [Bacteroidota bacterium]|nr:UV DNA damage repair endonuclease UvsE [Bacteroidota bacterium]
MRLGYACINLSLAEEKVQVNRSMMKRTFLEKGIPHASALALANCTDLEKIIDWNVANDLLMYRMSSDMFPWMSEYEIADLPDHVRIRKVLRRIGKKAKAGNIRLTYHPGPYNVLGTNSEKVLQNTIKELRQHGEIMDLIGLPRSAEAKINIHVGAAYGEKIAAMARFAENYVNLPVTTRSRLTVENDDKVNMYSIQDLLWLHEQVGIPLVFDHYHHTFCTGGMSEEEAFDAAFQTWPQQIIPVVHFSSSRKLEDPTAGATAHADHIYDHVKTYGRAVDIMFEAKAKDLAVLRYRQMHGALIGA